jgi:hypothetical protein
VSSFGFKARLFLLFDFVNRSAISRFVVVLVTIVTPHIGSLNILRRLLLIFFMLSIGSEAGLTRLIFSDIQYGM